MSSSQPFCIYKINLKAIAILNIVKFFKIVAIKFSSHSTESDHETKMTTVLSRTSHIILQRGCVEGGRMEGRRASRRNVGREKTHAENPEKNPWALDVLQSLLLNPGAK